jgi:hypothetical protein
MLTPGEVVLTPGQFAGAAGGDDGATLAFVRQELPKVIARAMRDEMQKVARR